MNSKDFYTFRRYMNSMDSRLTASMEDYMEMIYRLSQDNGFTRIHDLSESLNVQPSSATKMVQKLSEMGLLIYEKYGSISLKDSGKEVGVALLARHKVVEDFMRLIGVDEENVLEETEKVEHTLSQATLSCIGELVAFWRENDDVKTRFDGHRRGHTLDSNR